ncbi:MAG TPA: alternative ribosome rescue aminoacyl-tRNA hydrolase ArfB [Anaerolineae bacterium]|nr:alternative ribosome rescue aminoacyl-tRNA hydrolase ArfB [Anaerolineae bacterium]HOQ99088.1 alternative ribosome rescue aminoacyl-tRNA hydrolase ArfB [Anaerolineae bacterium]HPL28387.1 alternative ribosome rescue aminoacyl-tRNA hydrolase ArfB [Anaerolineae bacterium]HPL28388.1 alternative ribosome rescue aminoacyl-tRNA hydrolase ArfB [Anaerolineae bacterium]
MPITRSLAIPAGELRFRFSRSGGPGGQHVNRSATQVELLFDVAHSPSLSEEQRARVMADLATRIDREGVLHLFSSGTRSQLQNREEVVQRFQTLLRRALHVARPRHPTRPTAAARERRLSGKRRRGEAKERRRPVREEE